MVHRTIAGLGVGALLLIAAPAARAQAPTGGAQESTVSGTVVDVTCNFTKGVMGDAHRKCGEVCASAGLPLAILGDDGKLYIPLGADAGKPPLDLKGHVDHKVTVKGKVVASHGANGIVVSSVSM
jgi:hypothetical protein